jgi:hypothetical protein
MRKRQCQRLAEASTHLLLESKRLAWKWKKPPKM